MKLSSLLSNLRSPSEKPNATFCKPTLSPLLSTPSLYAPRTSTLSSDFLEHPPSFLQLSTISRCLSRVPVDSAGRIKSGYSWSKCSIYHDVVFIGFAFRRHSLLSLASNSLVACYRSVSLSRSLSSLPPPRLVPSPLVIPPLFESTFFSAFSISSL